MKKQKPYLNKWNVWNVKKEKKKNDKFLLENGLFKVHLTLKITHICNHKGTIITLLYLHQDYMEILTFNYTIKCCHFSKYFIII